MHQPTDLEALTARLRALEDERDILRALERYGHSIDYGLEQEWVDCFTEDGVYDFPGMTEPLVVLPAAELDAKGMRFRGHPALAAFVATHSRPPEARHKHVVADQVVTLGDDPDTARATSYFMRLDDVDGERLITAFGRYIDRLRRCGDGRWRFTERIVELESNAIASAESLDPPDH